MLDLQSLYKKPSLQELKNSLLWYAYISPYCLAIVSVIPVFLGSFFVVALFEHFRLQYLILGIVFLVFSVLCKKAPLVLASLFVIIVNYYFLSPYLISSPQVFSKDSRLSFTLGSFNVYTANLYHDEFIQQILRLNLDLVAILEVDESWSQSLRKLTLKYPHTFSIVREDNFGIFLLSKYPLSNSQIINLPTEAPPSLESNLEINGQTFHFLVAHPVPPVSQRSLELRDQQLSEIALNLAQSEAMHQVLLGDLNITPWAKNFQKLLKQAKLKDARQGFGYQGTWPTHKKFLFIPIDYILASEALRIKAFESIPILGSDHYGIIAKIDLITKH